MEHDEDVASPHTTRHRFIEGHLVRGGRYRGIVDHNVHPPLFDWKSAHAIAEHLIRCHNIHQLVRTNIERTSKRLGAALPTFTQTMREAISWRATAPSAKAIELSAGQGDRSRSLAFYSCREPLTASE